MAQPHAPATPSDEHMLAAWQQLAARDWPPLHELKRAAALYQLVRGAALRRANGLPPVQTPAPPAASPAAAPQRTAPAPPLRPPAFDHKRAAAGERDDE